jgi:integrase
LRALLRAPRSGFLFQDVVEDYQASDRSTLDDVQSRLKNHLTPFFGEIRATEFSTQHIKRYVAARRKEEAQNATINRELAIVRRAFSLAAKCDPLKVARVPHVQMLKESNVRTGFLEYEGYLALRNELPWYIRPLFVTAYHVGGRRGELTPVQWPQVDLNTNQIRLRATDTKNEEARTLPIYGDMREWLLTARKTRDEKFPKCPWVFYTDEGERLYWFYKAWESARVRAGAPDLLFHDLRRSAVRNMERAGITRKVAMSISGHKTENIYRRYDIVAERDLSDATARMDQYFTVMKEQSNKRLESAKSDATGTLLGTPEDSAEPEPKTPSAEPEPNP